MTRLLRFGCLAILAVALASCTSNSSTAPSSSAPFSSLDLLIGDGTAATNGQTLTVNYTGWLYDPSQPEDKGLVFDSNLSTDAPFTFVLGAQQVIAGWDQGLPGMKVGGIRRLVIPPSLGYGSTRQGAIPPYSTLVFEITLLDAEDASTTTTTSRIHR